MQIVSERQFDRVRLLLVDRSPTGATALAAGIEASAPGLEVTAVTGGRRAMELLRMQPFDVVLLDLARLADVASDPRDAASRLIKLAEGALAVALSSDASVSATVEVMRVGAHDCVGRQIEPGALARHIASLARRHGKTRMLGLIGGFSDSKMPQIDAITSRTPARAPAVLPMWRQEQRIIEDAIASFAGNVALAAAALELSPSTIYRKRQAWAEMDGKRGAA